MTRAHRSLIAALLPLTGCSGGIHVLGDRQIAVHGSYDHPISGPALYPEGDGRAENAGVTVAYHEFFADRTAFVSALTPYRNYNQSDGDIYTGEFQIGVRHYFWEFDLGKVPVGLFAEIYGGLLYGSESVPEEGSQANFTQDTGIGFEARLDKHISWISGYRLRHLSNGYIFSDKNPSQNDHQVFTGIAFTW
jgi:hypothetical protein